MPSTKDSMVAFFENSNLNTFLSGWVSPVFAKLAFSSATSHLGLIKSIAYIKQALIAVFNTYHALSTVMEDEMVTRLKYFRILNFRKICISVMKDRCSCEIVL